MRGRGRAGEPDPLGRGCVKAEVIGQAADLGVGLPGLKEAPILHNQLGDESVVDRITPEGFGEEADGRKTGGEEQQSQQGKDQVWAILPAQPAL